MVSRTYSHLLLSDGVLRMTLEAWVDDLLDVRVSLQVVCDDGGTALHGFHSDLKGLDASEKQVTIERTKVGSEACVTRSYSSC